MAHAIPNLVDERSATRELVLVGLELAKKGHAICEEDVDSWLRDHEEKAFPLAKSTIQARNVSGLVIKVTGRS
jgi:hypothetical protein